MPLSRILPQLFESLPEVHLRLQELHFSHLCGLRPGGFVRAPEVQALPFADPAKYRAAVMVFAGMARLEDYNRHVVAVREHFDNLGLQKVLAEILAVTPAVFDGLRKILAVLGSSFTQLSSMTASRSFRRSAATGRRG